MMVMIVRVKLLILTLRCINEWLYTEPSDVCTQRSCVDGTCAEELKNCDDGNPCTTDTCSVSKGGCQNVWECEDDNPCTDDLCTKISTTQFLCDYPPINNAGSYLTMGTLVRTIFVTTEYAPIRPSVPLKEDHAAKGTAVL